MLKRVKNKSGTVHSTVQGRNNNNITTIIIIMIIIISKLNISPAKIVRSPASVSEGVFADEDLPLAEYAAPH